jgi:hypothetical protein
VAVVEQLVTKFWKQEEWRSCLERPSTRVCDLLIGLPSGRARLADRLEEAAGWLGVEQAARWEMDAELEALSTSAAQVWDMVLDGADGPSSFMTSLSMATELLEGCVETVTVNGVC